MDEVLVLMIPFPAQGHLNQLLHLAHLMLSYGLPVHYAGSSTHNHQAKLRLHGQNSQSLTKICFHDLQLPPYASPPPKAENSTHFPTHLQPLFDASIHLRQPVFQLMQRLSTKFRRVVVIHDSLMTSVVQDINMIPNAENYAFIPVSAFTYFFNSWDRLQQKPFDINYTFVPKSIPSNEGCFTPEMLNLMSYQRGLMGFESGRLYNTSKVIESGYVQLSEKLLANDKIKHYAIGPLNPLKIINRSDENKHLCLQWLDKQEKGSVMYVSFGSTTSMTDEQITELAIGLERSAQKFLWVLRRADTSDISTSSGEARKPDQLPEGYETRVKDRGIVVKEWAPQLEILEHPSVGGFMSHCGWNSCIESISMGVPMVLWPMHSDQPRNACLVSDILRIGTLVRDWTHWNEVVSSTSIDSAVRRLMASEEGQEMRKRAAKLGDAVRASVDKGGTSSLELDSFISHITR